MYTGRTLWCEGVCERMGVIYKRKDGCPVCVCLCLSEWKDRIGVCVCVCLIERMGVVCLCVCVNGRMGVLCVYGCCVCPCV